MDYEGFDLNLIVAFNALMSELHVTRAANRCGLSQPAMSAALSRLRKMTGDELFVRSPKGLAPTPRAHELVAPFSAALESISEALDLRTHFRPESSTQRFALALSDHPAQRLLPPLSQILAREAPGVDLKVLGFNHRHDAIRSLDEGVADVAVGVSPGSEARILTQRLFTERFVCISRKGSTAAAALANIEDFARQKHVLVSPEGDERGIVDIELTRMGLSRRLGVVLPHMYAAPAIVSVSDFVATLMEGVVARSGLTNRLHVSPPPLDLPQIDFHLFWHRRTDQHPAYRWFRERIAQAAWS